MTSRRRRESSAAKGAGNGKVLIVYCTHTGNTKYIAEKIEEKTRGCIQN